MNRLENRVEERTQELSAALENLEAAEEELQVQNEELQDSLEKEKALRNQLVQSEKYAALARLIASVTHEIQNPLQTIKNSLYFMKDEPCSPLGHEMLDMAISESNRMSDLVAQIRDTYRPADVRMADFDLIDILNKVHRLLDLQLRNNHVEWSLENQPGRIPLYGVPDRIQQVFMNICLNAADAMGCEGGQLKVRVAQSDHQAVVTFQDNGLGIPPENLQKIFEPFFTTKAKGSGLGLAICYEIIRDHGGEISVESQPGAGTTFKVVLPLNGE